ncbi:hypothetical protein ACH4SK_36530 [Streptomyces inhibens]|uniref:hypothetical protein n=1 Tax=Streptomyces inhibens TaxID=2293571 RepID=UPI00378F4CEA
MRRRVSYETWHFLHFATYLAVYLAFWHQVGMGEDLAGNLAWNALYIAVAVLLVWYRFALPVRRALHHQLKVADVRPEAPGVVSVTRVLAEGPYGAFTARRRTTPKVLLLGGGVGITPLRTLFETLPGDVTLPYRARQPEDLVFRTELDALAAARGAVVHYLVGESPAHFSPLTPQALRHLVPDLTERDVYLCGPPRMAEAAKRALRDAGVPRRRIHHESFEF